MIPRKVFIFDKLNKKLTYIKLFNVIYRLIAICAYPLLFFFILVLMTNFSPGALIIHALDEKVRAYYNLEKLWTTEESNKEQSQVRFRCSSIGLLIP